MQVVGADGVKNGWVAVALDGGRFTGAAVFATAVDLAAAYPEALVIGIDIPIGLPSSGVRQADRATRRFVGRRSSSVFAAPPRIVLEAPTYAEARAVAVGRWVQGVSAQAYRLGPKVIEVADLADARLLEVHPEAAFRALAGRPLAFPKKSWNGQMERRSLLADAGIVLPDAMADDVGAIPPDDVLDAAAAAWSADRHARGRSRSLPYPPEAGPGGRAVAIWY
jgi:predicted RNase H-like nuclease